MAMVLMRPQWHLESSTQLVSVELELHLIPTTFARGNQGRLQKASSGAGLMCADAYEGADCDLTSEARLPQRFPLSHIQIRAHSRPLFVGLLQEGREIKSPHNVWVRRELSNYLNQPPIVGASGKFYCSDSRSLPKPQLASCSFPFLLTSPGAPVAYFPL